MKRNAAAGGGMKLRKGGHPTKTLAKSKGSTNKLASREDARDEGGSTSLGQDNSVFSNAGTQPPGGSSLAHTTSMTAMGRNESETVGT